MKKILCLLVVLTACVVLSTSVWGQEEVTVYVNGSQIVSEVPAIVDNGVTMLPFRDILRALGVKDTEIVWHENSKSIEITTGGKYIFIAIGSSGAIVDDRMITLLAAPYVTNGRTLIPVRFISEALGASVGWNGDTSTVTITK